jgi:hypothetical protein
MKKIIVSLVILTIFTLANLDSYVAIKFGRVDIISENTTTYITFKCTGVAGICTGEYFSNWEHITITGFPEYWIVDSYINTPIDDGREVSATIAN